MATTGPNLGQIEYEAQGVNWFTPLKALLRAVDGLVQPAVEDKDLSTPPGTPSNGDRYLVGATATDAWATHEGEIARYQSSDVEAGAGWEFFAPSEGWQVYVRDENAFYRYDGSAWSIPVSSGAIPQSLIDAVGDLIYGSAADTAARLAGNTTATKKFLTQTGDGTNSAAPAWGTIATGDVPDLSATYGTVAQAKAEVLMVAVSDETTALTTGTGKVTFRMPWAMTVTAVRASLTTASSSGVVTVDINEGGVSILSTTLTIDASEKTSTTAATAAVISDAALADDAEITVDIDTAGTGAAGLKVSLIGTRA